MGEYIPVVNKKGEIIKYISVGSDFFALLNDSEMVNIYFWAEKDKAYLINPLIDSTYHITFNSYTIYLLNFLDLTPTLFGYVAYDVDEYVDFLMSQIYEYIKNKKILLSYSGGKDSNASLIILKKLQELIDFDLYVVYVHMPFLDSEKSIDEARNIINRIGFDLIVLEADRELIQKRIEEERLPYRGFRWCTYQKIKPLRKFKKENDIDYEVINDRAFETFKRLESFVAYAMQRRFISGKKFRPIYPLTFLDIVKINREYKLVHPDYLNANTRVSCALCPYRSLLEINHINMTKIAGDHRLYNILRRLYQTYYSNYVTYDYYISYGMWRYGRHQTEQIIKFRNFILNSSDTHGENHTLSKKEVLKYLKSPWINPLPDAKRYDVDSALKKIVESISA